jgi:hypothetical protein
MIEIWRRQSLWGGDDDVIVQDREGLKKKGYFQISGAYYSARLAPCEYLVQKKKSARVIFLRSISSDYWAPLGTWVIREATRKALANPPVIYESLAVAVRQVSMLLGSDSWVSYSTLIPELRTQRTLF